MLATYDQLINKLDELKIPYHFVEHPPAITTAQADSYIEGYRGVRTKTMILANKKKTAFYMVILDDKKRLDVDLLKQIVGSGRLHLVSEETLIEQLGQPAGLVSPFGLLNNSNGNMQVYFDREMLEEPILTFHPNINTKTIFVDTKDVLRFVNETGFEYQVVEL